MESPCFLVAVDGPNSAHLKEVTVRVFILINHDMERANTAWHNDFIHLRGGEHPLDRI